jgi:hypothetical protein
MLNKKFELVLSDIIEQDNQSRRIITCNGFEIDVFANEDGITIEVMKNDEVVAECAVDFNGDM